MKYLFFSLVSFFALAPGEGIAQGNGYSDSLQVFRKKYIDEHEIIKSEDKKRLCFFPVDASYYVTARFERAKEVPWFRIETTGREKKLFRVYGILYFSIHDTAMTLQVYQSQGLLAVPKYADYLLIAFTDKTTGSNTYENGRYIDATTGEMENGFNLLDFNKAYNPYCAYVSNVYNCPLPPKENDLPVAIRAGEMKYKKDH